jgi:hypothetical protein
MCMWLPVIWLKVDEHEGTISLTELKYQTWEHANISQCKISITHDQYH